MSTYHVHATWDPEAQVWVATSEDVPGLVTEAATVEAFTDRLRFMIPKLLEANSVPSPDGASISFELAFCGREGVKRPSIGHFSCLPASQAAS